MAKATRRDIPAVCMLFAVITTMCTLMFAYGWQLDLVQKSELQRVAGFVESVHHTNLSKAGYKLHIEITDGAKRYHLTQDDLTWSVPNLRTVGRGDAVVAYVYPDSLGRQIYWLWSLERDGQLILTYDETYAYLAGKGKRMQPFVLPAAFASVLLFAVATTLRVRYGAWRSEVDSETGAKL